MQQFLSLTRHNAAAGQRENGLIGYSAPEGMEEDPGRGRWLAEAAKID